MANATKQKSPNELADSSNNTWGGVAPNNHKNTSDSAQEYLNSVRKDPTETSNQEAPGNTRSTKENSNKATPPKQDNNKVDNKFKKGLDKVGGAANNINTIRNIANDPNKIGAAANAAKEFAINKAADALAAETGGLSLLLKNRTIRRILLWTVGIITAAVILYFLIQLALILMLLGYSANKQNQDNNTNTNNSNLTLTLTKEAPQSVPNGTDIPYKVNYNFNGSATELTIIDQLPNTVSMVTYPPTAQYDKATNTLTWKRSKQQPTAGVGGLFTSDQLSGNFSFTVHPNNDTYVYNIVKGTVTGAVTTGTGGSGFASPSTNDCNGAYKNMIAQNIAIPLFEYKSDPNFGDPNCSFTNFASGPTDPAVLDNLYSKIKDALAATNSPADDLNAWKSIIPCESSYDANNFTPKSESGFGAYGLFQMNPHYVPTANGAYAVDPQNQPIVAGNTQYDRGDVNWELQIKNAINQNTLSQCKWAYWGCSPKTLTASCISPGNAHPAN